jgi:hypothetical protein
MPSSQIVIFRAPDPWGDPNAAYGVVIDGSVVGKIQADQAKVFKVQPGTHTVRVKYLLQKSNDAEVSVEDGQTVELACTRRKRWETLLTLTRFLDLHPITDEEVQERAERAAKRAAAIEVPTPRNLGELE